MGNTPRNTDTGLYILTFFSIVLLVGCFATQIITGKEPVLIMDSLAGSILFGSVFFLFLCWFVYDTSVRKQINITQAAKITLTATMVSYCIYAYWFVFILIPVVLNAA